MGARQCGASVKRRAASVKRRAAVAVKTGIDTSEDEDEKIHLQQKMVAMEKGMMLLRKQVGGSASCSSGNGEEGHSSLATSGVASGERRCEEAAQQTGSIRKRKREESRETSGSH